MPASVKMDMPDAGVLGVAYIDTQLSLSGSLARPSPTTTTTPPSSFSASLLPQLLDPAVVDDIGFGFFRQLVFPLPLCFFVGCNPAQFPSPFFAP